MVETIATYLYNISALIALIGLIFAFLRMIKGPTIADRATALDTMTLISISLIIYISVLLGRKIYIDVAMIYALISFIGVVAVARYLERGL